MFSSVQTNLFLSLGFPTQKVSQDTSNTYVKSQEIEKFNKLSPSNQNACRQHLKLKHKEVKSACFVMHCLKSLTIKNLLYFKV